MKILVSLFVGCGLVGLAGCKKEVSTEEIFRDMAKDISVKKPIVFQALDDKTQLGITISEGQEIESGSVTGYLNNLSAAENDVIKYSSWKRSFLGQDRSADDLLNVIAITGSGTASVFPFERKTANKGFLVNHSKLGSWARIWDVTEMQTVLINFEGKVSSDAVDVRSLAAVLSTLKWPDQNAEQDAPSNGG